MTPPASSSLSPSSTILRLCRRALALTPGSSSRHVAPPSSSRLREEEVVVRFAPSPTGRLHVGGARTALVNFAFARRHGGRFLLRLEDTDAKRCRPEAAGDILDCLNWLGLRPDNADCLVIQSGRLPLYREAASQLVAGGFAYPCYCSEHRIELLRRQQRASGLPPGYDGKCRSLTAAERHQIGRGGQAPHVIRFDMSAAADRLLAANSSIRIRDLLLGDLTFPISGLEADPVLLKSDGWPVYHLASVLDDRLAGVSHVIRGREWLPSAPKHALLRDAMDAVNCGGGQVDEGGKKKPIVFAHLPLLLDWRDGAKLSKRRQKAATSTATRGETHGLAVVATEISELRSIGYLPEAVVDWLVSATWLGKPESLAPGEVLPQFCRAIRLGDGGDGDGDGDGGGGVGARDVRLDPSALRGAGLKSLAPESATPETLAAVRGRLAAAADGTLEAGDCADGFNPTDSELLRCLATLRGRLATLDDVESHGYLFRPPGAKEIHQGLSELLLQASSSQSSWSTGLQGLANAAADLLLTEAAASSPQSLSSSSPAAAAEKPAPLVYKAARVALTGRQRGPPVGEICQHLGSAEVARRASGVRRDVLALEAESASKISSASTAAAGGGGGSS